MTTLFDTALPPIWYLLFWVACIVAVRLFIVNPLLRESERVRAEIKHGMERFVSKEPAKR